MAFNFLAVLFGGGIVKGGERSASERVRKKEAFSVGDSEVEMCANKTVKS